MATEFWKDCPNVQVDPGKLNGEPTVGPYRLEARTVVDCEGLGETPEEIADDYGVPLEYVKSILEYYHARQEQMSSSH